MNITETLERIKNAKVNPEIIRHLERVIANEKDNTLVTLAVSSVAACCLR